MSDVAIHLKEFEKLGLIRFIIERGCKCLSDYDQAYVATTGNLEEAFNHFTRAAELLKSIYGED